MPDIQRLHRIEQLIASCFGIQLLISWKLWTSIGRAFPKAGLLPFWQFDWPFAMSGLLYGGMLLSLLAIVLQKFKQLAFWSLLLCFFLVLLEDATRIQVWVYLWLLMLFATNSLAKRPEFGIQMLLLIVAALYSWGGLHKFNVYFQEDIFPWMVEPFLQALPAWAGLAVATFELLIGIWLLIGRRRRLLCFTLFFFHLGILICLGPFGHNWNPVVWPWNIAMPIFAYLLLYDNQLLIRVELYKKMKINPSAGLLFLLILPAPALNYIGWWPEPLAFKMYAGTNPEGVLFYSEADRACIPAAVHDEVLESRPFQSDRSERLVLDSWCMKELGVPPLATDRHMQLMTTKLCHCWQNPEIAGLEILKVNPFDKKDDQLLRISCESLIHANAN